MVNFEDLAEMKAVFFGNDPDADLDGDGSVNRNDFAIMKAGFFAPPGPSGVLKPMQVSGWIGPVELPRRGLNRCGSGRLAVWQALFELPPMAPHGACTTRGGSFRRIRPKNEELTVISIKMEQVNEN